MPGKQLGDGMNDDVRAVVKGLQRTRGREGVVDHKQHAAFPADRCNAIEVSDPQGGVRDDLDHHHFGLRPNGIRNRLCIARVDKCVTHAEARQVLGQQAQGPSIELITRNNMIAALQQPEEDRRYRRHA